MAINLIGWTTLPYSHWISKPLEIHCGSGQSVNYGGSGSSSGGQSHTIPPTNPPLTSAPATSASVTGKHVHVAMIFLVEVGPEVDIQYKAKI